MSQTNSITDEDLLSVINDNQYVTSCTSNKNRDPNSLSYLITRTLSQSDCIKLGNGVEKVLSDLIIKRTKHTNIKPKNIKGNKEKDHLFCNEETKTIYYAELKANVDLDTEKSKSTYEKCLEVVESLKREYPDYKIEWCLLAYRFLNYNDIPNVIKKKYVNIKDNVFGINQYLSMLGIDLTFTYERYVRFLNNIADKMFDN